MNYPVSLTSLTPREAVADALYRALIGLDRNDQKMFDSAWAGEDVYMAITGGEDSRVFESLSSLHENGLGRVGPMVTTHTASNVRVDLRDDRTASLTAYVLAQHAAPGKGNDADGPKFLACGESQMDLILDSTDGQWKIKRWIYEILWRQGDRAVVRGESQQ